MDDLSDDDVRTLHRAGESERLERKPNARDLDRIREAVSAFANDLPGSGKAGVVVVGVQDDGACVGITVDDPLLRRLSGIRDDGAITPFPAMAVRPLELDGCRVAVIIVQPSVNPPVRVRGRTWVRVGPRRAVASPEEERRLVERRRWANLPFDAQPVSGANLGDLDLVRFRLEYLPALVSPDTLAQNERTPEQQLRALRLADPAGTPTVTAILALGTSPQSWFPGAVIAWRRVAGAAFEDETLDDRTLTGTLADQLRVVDELADAALSSAVELTATTHRRRVDYPLAALQQLIRNAVMHRTYEATATPVRVTWFADRIEILSPGAPFGSVTPATLGQPGFTDYRNPTIAEMLKGYGFVERFGQGIALTRAALARNGNPPLGLACPPEQSPAWVLATIRRAA